MRFHALRPVAIGACLVWMASSAHAAGKIAWVASYKDALAQAKTSHKLIMADMYTDWCGWCKKLDSDTYTDAKVIELSAQFIPVKINAEKEGVAEAKKFNVTGYPTILFINENGEAESKIVGYLPGKGFADQMTSIMQAHKDFPLLMDRAKKDPNDLEASAKLAAIYAGRGDESNAKIYLAQAEKVDPDNAKDMLTKAYNALGDYYQNLATTEAANPANADKANALFEKAIPLFHKAAKTGKMPADRSYGYLSAAVCYIYENKLKESVPDLQAVIDLKDAPADDKQSAQDTLAKVKKALGS